MAGSGLSDQQHRSGAPAPEPAGSATLPALACVVAVPARLESSRLPNKVMAYIGGQPMLQRVLLRCRQARRPAAVVLCTDSEVLRAAAEGWGFPVLMTSTGCGSGSERLASVVEALTARAGAAGAAAARSVIINVQGDQPFIDPPVIDAMALEFERRTPTPEVLTPIYRMPPEKIHDPNVVKTLLAADGRALYFSRAPIPLHRDAAAGTTPRATPLRHVGLYAYRAAFLPAFAAWPPSPLEETESLEQLRVLERGHGIAVSVRTVTSQGIDTAEQYAAFVRRTQSR